MAEGARLQGLGGGGICDFGEFARFGLWASGLLDFGLLFSSVVSVL